MIAIRSADEADITMLPAARFNEVLVQVESTADVAMVMHAKLLIQVQFLNFWRLRQLIDSLSISSFKPILLGELRRRGIIQHRPTHLVNLISLEVIPIATCAILVGSIAEIGLTLIDLDVFAQSILDVLNRVWFREAVIFSVAADLARIAQFQISLSVSAVECITGLFWKIVSIDFHAIRPLRPIERVVRRVVDWLRQLGAIEVRPVELRAVELGTIRFRSVVSSVIWRFATSAIQLFLSIENGVGSRVILRSSLVKTAILVAAASTKRLRIV